VSRLFACLWLPDDATSALEELHRKDQVGARFVPPARWHVTLRFFGDADPNIVDGRLRSADFEPTTVALGPAVDVGSERILFVPASGTEQLADAANEVAGDLGTEPPRRRHLGHVTIARLARRANMPRALGDLVTASWDPTEVALVESTLRPDGPRYDTLATYPVTR